MLNDAEATGQLAGLTQVHASPTSEGYGSLSISATSRGVAAQLRNLSARLPRVLSDGGVTVTDQLAGLTKDHASPTSKGYDSLSISTTSRGVAAQLRNLSALLPHVLSDGCATGQLAHLRSCKKARA